MKRLFRFSAWHVCRLVALAAVLGVSWPVDLAHAQGVTTGVIMGVVRDVQGQPVAGAGVTAIHLPSGTAYETVTRADGRFSIPGMRVGGPYSVTVFQGGTRCAQLRAADPGKRDGQPGRRDRSRVRRAPGHPGTGPGHGAVRPGLQLGAHGRGDEHQPRDAGDAARRSPAGSSTMTRLTPQAGTTMSFAGQDNRLNNITVDGSYFNNSFGLAGTPGERTGVAPISLSSIEQVQVSVAPFDVRQGNFVGAAVNTVTRSGTNALHGSLLARLARRKPRRHQGRRRDVQPRHVQLTGTPAAGHPGPSSRTVRSSSAVTRTRSSSSRARRSAPTRAESRSAATLRACSLQTSRR